MDMKKKLLFVFNPCSGKAQIKNQLLDIVDTMVKADYEVTIYPTQCAGDAKEKVEGVGYNEYDESLSADQNRRVEVYMYASEQMIKNAEANN